MHHSKKNQVYAIVCGGCVVKPCMGCAGGCGVKHCMGCAGGCGVKHW